jgi:hypothetical protein
MRACSGDLVLETFARLIGSETASRNTGNTNNDVVTSAGYCRTSMMRSRRVDLNVARPRIRTIAVVR